MFPPVVRRAVSWWLFAGLPLAALLALLWREQTAGIIAGDFHHELYPQVRAFLDHGVAFDSPKADIEDGAGAIFTIVVVFAAVPLALLPATVAEWTMTLVVIALAVAALRTLGVRDWRVYGLVAATPPFLSAVETGNVTTLLLLLVALAWRHRHRRFMPGVFVGAAIAVKLFPWPLVAWLLATRRFAAAVVAAAVGSLSLVLLLPFGNPLDFIRLILRLTEAMDDHAYSLYALLGADPAARAVWLLVGATVLAAVFVLDDRRSFTIAVAACLLASPIVWLHYFLLLAAPAAVARPRLAWIWFAPLGFWLVPFGYAAPWQSIVALALFVTVTIGTLEFEMGLRARLQNVAAAFRSTADETPVF